MPGIAEVAVYVVAILLVVWPAVWHARTQIFGAGDDARYYTWLGWRMGRLIAHGHIVPFHVGDVIHPFGLDLRLLDGYLPSYVSGLFNLIVGPILAFNLTFVMGAILNVLAARALARRLSPLRLVHTIAAVAFLTAPPIALNVQLGLLPLFWAFTAPLLIADALDVVTGTRGVRPVRLAVLLVVAYLCSVYFVVFGGLAYGLIVGIAAVRDARLAHPEVDRCGRADRGDRRCCRSSCRASCSITTSRRAASTPNCSPTATSSPPTRSRSWRNRPGPRSCCHDRRSSRRASCASRMCATRSRRRSSPVSCCSSASSCS